MRVRTIRKFFLALIALVLFYLFVHPHWEFFNLRKALEKEETILSIIEEVQSVMNYDKFQYYVFDSEDAFISPKERLEKGKEFFVPLYPIISPDEFNDNLKEKLKVNKNQMLWSDLYLKNDQISCFRIFLRNNAWEVFIINSELGSQCQVPHPVLLEIEHGKYSVSVSQSRSRFRD